MKKKNHKYIFVTGGVMSGVGKGIASSSIGKILQSKNYKVNPIKVDPYLNVDAGMMNPTEHGEVFVIDSGLECDQDLGNYERFMDIDLKPDNYMTSGMIYQYVIDKERNLGYKGKCVEAIPHITGEITRRIQKSAEASGADISIIEIGGTVGDYQNVMFIETARILKLKNPDDVIFVLVSYLPIPSTLGEMKTRPTQNAVRNLNSYGVQPEIIIARGAVPLDERRKEKIAVSCNIAVENVISAPDVESIYDVPLNFEKDNLGEIILKSLRLKTKNEKDMKEWSSFVAKVKSTKEEASIAVIGKYFDTGDFVLSDAYISVIEAVKYSAYELGVKAKLTWLNSKDFENGEKEVLMLGDFDGVIVPGGFGESGIEGKLKAIKFARENKIPYLGLCYGMQLAVIEYARNVIGLKDANTTEIDENSKDPVIDIMDGQKKNIEDGKYGGTMRLGAYRAILEKGTIARSAYGKDEVWERHRHRYEVNPDYVKKIESAGLVFSGKSPDGTLMEIAELPRNVHPFFLGAQFHPEFKARPLHPHPLFTEFMKAAIERKKK
ncbi:MAG: CTP synthase [Patescibacteria group bacterium]|nr:CTP synthase [Patescibacteria group bacterium]MDE2217942.1 CTP synthase [Patescibacteria group bacterium]